MNSRKNVFQDVLDPFEIEDDWFELEFAFFQLLPAARLADPAIIDAIHDTVDRLKLNDFECCETRAEWYAEWEAGEVSSQFMSRRAPLVYREAVRQGLVP
jgi:hypothetical protein